MFRMKKVVVTAFGDESNLKLVEAELPNPGSGDVQLSVEYSIVCGSDANMLRGEYPFQKKPPFTPGYSVIGTVRQNGAGCAKFKIGQRVACLTKYDGQAEFVNQPEKYLVPVPEGVDPKAAVPIILDWLTAYQMLQHTARVQPGQRIFVHALSGAVGGAFLRLGVILGAEIYGTASPKNHDELRKFGAHPFDYSNFDWVAAMQKLGGVDAAFDPLGYESFDRSYSILKRGGILVGYGTNLPAWTKTPPRPMLPTTLKLLARNVAFWTGKRTTFFGVTRGSKHFAPDLQHLFQWLKEGKIFPPIKAVFRLDQIQEAHRAYAAGPGTGAVVIRVTH
jgi:NADPH:quinone reductase-like Zn-dependent oxidoreductase